MKKVLTTLIVIVVLGAAFYVGIRYQRKHQAAPASNTPVATAPANESAPAPTFKFLSPAGEEKWRLGSSYELKWEASGITTDYYLYDYTFQGDGWHVNQSTGSLGKIIDLAAGHLTWDLGQKYNPGIHKLVASSAANDAQINDGNMYESAVFCVEVQIDIHDTSCNQALSDYHNYESSLKNQPVFTPGPADAGNVSEGHIDEFNGAIKGWAYDRNRYMKVKIVLANAADPKDTWTYYVDTHNQQTSEYILTPRPDVGEYLKSEGAVDTSRLANFSIGALLHLHPGKWVIKTAAYGNHSFILSAAARQPYTVPVK